MTNRSAPSPAPAGDPVPYAPFLPTFVVLGFTALIATSQLYGAIPLLGPMGRTWHVAPTSLILLISTFAVGYAAAFLLFGPLSDRYGRKRLIVLSAAATTVTTLLVAFAPNPDAALGLRVLQGLSMGAFPPSAFAYIATQIEPRRRLAATTAMTTGLLAAAVVGQVCAQWLAARWGWRSFFVASSGSLLLCAVASAAVLRPARTTATSPLTAYRAMGRLLRSGPLARLYLATPTLLGSFVAIFTGLELAKVPDLLSLRATGLPVILAVPFLSPLLRRMPATVRTACGLLLAAASAALIGLLHPGTGPLIALLLGLTAGIAVAIPSLVEAVGAQAGAARAAGTSLFTFLLFFGASAGAPIATRLTGHGLSLLAVVLAVVLAVGCLLVFSVPAPPAAAGPPLNVPTHDRTAAPGGTAAPTTVGRN